MEQSKRYALTMRDECEGELTCEFTIASSEAPEGLGQLALARLRAASIARRWLRENEYLIPTGEARVTAYYHVAPVEEPDNYQYGEVSILVTA